MTVRGSIRRSARGVLVAAALLAAASPAAAATRYADPASVDVTGTCATSGSACRIDHAINNASLGDTVKLADGDYTISYQVQATQPVTIEPASAADEPRLVGQAGLGFPTLELANGGTVRGIQVETNAQVALQLDAGARAEAVIAIAHDTDNTGVAVRTLSAATATELVNTVARSATGNAAVHMVDGAVPGATSVANVTAIATGSGSSAVLTDHALVGPVLTNVVARGASMDIETQALSMSATVANSNFRTANSSSFTNGGFNQTADPTWADADYRPAAGSVTRDAGSLLGLITGTFDPDGNDRVIGDFPDIGAFEFKPVGGGGGGGGGGGTGGGGGGGGGGGSSDPGRGGDPARIAGVLPPLAPPVLSTSVAVEPAQGSVGVRLPGTNDFVPLSAGSAIPVGSVVDTRRGRVTLTSVRDASGELQTGTFWGGVFRVRQKDGANPLTELVLTGGDFSRCANRRDSSKNVAFGSRARHSARVRRLWGRDRKGRFRTKGRKSHATVRGTKWLVEDRCDGTLTKVKQGAVVVKDFGERGRVRVEAGERYLAR